MIKHEISAYSHWGVWMWIKTVSGYPLKLIRLFDSEKGTSSEEERA